jgi:phospholipase C
MRGLHTVLLTLAAFAVSATSAFATVSVTSPANGSTVTSPVHYVATASTSTCAKGVASMGIYVNNKLTYVVNGASLNTSISLSPAKYDTVVEEWDHCGGASYTHIAVTVTSPTGGGSTGVTVTSPAPNSTVTSPVHYVATAGTSTCSKGVASMGIYVNNKLVYTVKGSSLDTQMTLAAGPEHTVVEEWDFCGGASYTTINLTVQGSTSQVPTVNISASPTSISAGDSSTLTVTATNATQVTISGSDGTVYNLQPGGGTQLVTPSSTTSYTAEATGSGQNATASTTVTVATSDGLQSIKHVIFMLQENHSFDNYFGMLNPYRIARSWNIGDDGHVYTVDGIDDKLNTTNVDNEGVSIPLFKLKSTCIDDASSSWLESYGDVNRYNFLISRPILMDGFVHNAEGFAKSCAASKTCSGQFTDLTGQRAMGYYDSGFLNYYYYVASQFALSDRWFSPVSSKSAPNRVATFTGGTTQGLVFDAGNDDHVSPLNIPTIFQELDNANVSWKVYYSATDGFCLAGKACGTSSGNYPATYLTYFSYYHKYLYKNPTHAACTGTTKPSSVVGDTSNYFCIDTNHVAPLGSYFTDLSNGTLPSFAFIESGSGINDEHPGSGQTILSGQVAVAKIVNAFMTSPAWSNSVFFFSYDEGGGPYDHVPPVPGHSNDKTNASLGAIPDIATIAVNADGFKPCVPSGGTATLHCDLKSTDPGAHSGDAAAAEGLAAQLGFRVPNFVVSPFARRHYVSHIPMDHTAVIKFVENRFIGSTAHLTARDAAQPNLLDFFDFTIIPWATPPVPPSPVTTSSCTPAAMQ